MDAKKRVTMDDVRAEVRTYIQNEENLSIVDKAYAYAELHHREQFRKRSEERRVG